MKNKKSKFVHLHVHSEYSLLDGMAKIPELVKKAKEDGMKAVALTDHGVMYGAIEFYKKCKEGGIKPIVGVEIYIAPRGMEDRTPKLDTSPHHLILLAKSNLGYKNLMKLVTLAHIKGYYYKPRIDKKTLKKYSKDLIALTACLQGEIPRLILGNNLEAAKEKIKEYKSIFGQDNFYLEIQPHPNIEEQKRANKSIIKLSRETNTPLVVTKDVHYLGKEDKESHEVQLCIQTGKTMLDERRMSMAKDDFDFPTAKEMEKECQDFPKEATENTKKIADLCNLEIKLGDPIFPHFEVPKGHTATTFLKELCLQGYAWRYLGIEREKATKMDTKKIAKKMDKEKKKRLDYELGIIDKCAFSSYFLIVADFIRFSQDSGILIGPGRGSAAGSFASYLLGITGIDPLEHDLLFERFLNPERVSEPDFDIDFADTRRGEVIEYVMKKYGKDHVAQIITFGRMESRAAIRDVTRALGMSYNEGDRIAKLIPFGYKLSQVLEEVEELRAQYEGDARVQKLIDLAMKLEGVARHASTHAAGVVISRGKLTDYTPIQLSTRGDISQTTQYSMYHVESVGLVKMDFLGLSNLSILQNALRIIRAVHKIEIDLSDIPIDDKKTYELLSRAETIGVFQLASDGIRRYLKELKPTTFEDIVAMVALYRPGPIENIPDFIAAKHGRKEVTYLDPRLEPILEKTYGVIVNQEQVLQIARDLGGFSYGEADILRRAVGKKIKELLIEQRGKLMHGMKKNGVDGATALKIWNFIEPFAKYGFNKSHAAGYAMIAYQTAYLKAYYPSAFMAALLTSDQDDLDKVARDIQECERMGLKVLPPDVNESFPEFAVVPKSGNIRFALSAIKNVGFKVSQEIEEERKKGGKYKSLEDFIKRLKETVNKKLLESLIRSGALDSFGERASMFASIPEILRLAAYERRSAAAGQIGLFGESDDSETRITLSETKATKEERLSWEKELLGVYLSEHPLDDFKDVLQALPDKASGLGELSENTQVEIGGIINGIQKILTKTGEPMLFVTLEDLIGGVELLVFPAILKDDPILWQEGKMIHVSGRLSFKDGRGNTSEPKVIVNKVRQLEKKPELFEKGAIQKRQKEPMSIANNNGALHLRINNDSGKKILQKIKKALEKHKGETDVVLHLPEGEKFRPVKITTKVAPTDEMLKGLKKILGEDNVRHKESEELVKT